jgi:heptosyltransferase III
MINQKLLIPITKKLNDDRENLIYSHEKIKNILIVKQHNQFGDMLCTVPMFAALKRKFPKSHISLVVSPGNYEILTGDEQFIDRFIVYDKTSAIKILKFYTDLKKCKYQLGIVPSTVSFSRTSHIINYLSGAKSKVGAKSIDGKINKTHKLLDIKKDFSWDGKFIHQSDRFMDIIRQLGCDLKKSESKEILLKFTGKEIKTTDELFESKFPEHITPVIAIHPGARKIPNRWSLDYFEKLITLLYKKFGAKFYMVSGPLDKDIIPKLAEKFRNSEILIEKYKNLHIRIATALICRSDLYITNDTGTMHSAAYFGGRVLSLFGPTNGWEWAPEKPDCDYIQSPTSNINDITPEQVLEKAKKMLAGFPNLK